MRFLKPLLYLLPGLPAVLIFFLTSRDAFLYGDTAFVAFRSLSLNEIFPLLHFSTNSYVNWRLEPGTFFFFSRFGYGGYIGWIYFLFGLGLTLAIRQLGKLSDFRSAFTSLAVSMLLLHLFGFDTLVLSFATAFVWQLFAFSRFGERSELRAKDYVPVVLAAVFACDLANQLALLSTLLAATGTLNPRTGRVMTVSFAIALGCALLFPSPDFPDYGTKGHVVPYYGITDGLQPLIGNEPPLFHVNRQFIRSAFSLPALQLVIISGGLLLALRPRRRSTLRQEAPLWIALTLSVSLVLDSATVDAGLSQIAPLQSLSRVLPGMFFLSLAPFALAAAIVCCSLFAPTNLFTTALFVCGIVLTFRGEPLSSTLADELLWRETASLRPPNRERTEKLLTSPSYWLMREYGLNTIELNAALKDRPFTPAKDLPLTIGAAINEPGTPLMRDGDDATAWGTRSGGQRGNEWLNFVFPEPRKVAAIRLETGKYFTDFARWLEVRTAGSCGESDRSFESYAVVFPSRENQGGVQITPQGYPYFTTQYATTIALPADQPVKCILVRQTGTDKNFDWSVSEVSFVLE